MSAIAVGEITIIDLHDEDVHIGTTAPVDLKDGRLWLDTSTVPNVMKRWDAATQKWVKASPTEASDIGAETPSGAQDKADGARDAAKTYAGDILKDLADGKYANGSFIDETKITSPTVISPNVIGLQGTFADLLAGDPFGARLELGEDDGEPFLEAYDDTELRFIIKENKIEFWANGRQAGHIWATILDSAHAPIPGIDIVAGSGRYMRLECPDNPIRLRAPNVDISVMDNYIGEGEARLTSELNRNMSFETWGPGPTGPSDGRLYTRVLIEEDDLKVSGRVYVGGMQHEAVFFANYEDW